MNDIDNTLGAETLEDVLISPLSVTNVSNYLYIINFVNGDFDGLNVNIWWNKFNMSFLECVKCERLCYFIEKCG